MKSCCCCGFELRGGSIASACYTILLALFSLGLLSYMVHDTQTVKQYDENGYHRYGGDFHDQPQLEKSHNWVMYVFISGIVFHSLIVLASALLLAGVNKKKAGLMVPWVVMIILKVVLSFLSIMGAIIMMIRPMGTYNLVSGLTSVGVLIGMICLDSYCIACVCAYRKEMIAERLANSRATGCVTDGGISMESKVYNPQEAVITDKYNAPLLIISSEPPPAYARI